MFVEDYRELKIENAENIAGRCFLFEKFVADLLAKEPEALRFNERSANVAHPPALPCQIDSQSGVHGHAGRTFAWKKSHGVGHSVLRNGRRIRRARRKIRSIAPSRATLARSNRQSAPRDRSNRVRHKLPPSNYRPNESPAKTHGRVARRSVGVAPASGCRLQPFAPGDCQYGSRSTGIKIRANGLPRLLRQRAVASSRRLIGRGRGTTIAGRFLQIILSQAGNFHQRAQ